MNIGRAVHLRARKSTSSENLLDDRAMDFREALTTTLVQVTKGILIQAQLVQHRRMQIA